jgi:hypothetical protein
MSYTETHVAEVFGQLMQKLESIGQKTYTYELYKKPYAGYLIRQKIREATFYYPFGTEPRTAKEMYLSLYMACNLLEEVHEQKESEQTQVFAFNRGKR